MHFPREETQDYFLQHISISLPDLVLWDLKDGYFHHDSSWEAILFK